MGFLSEVGRRGYQLVPPSVLRTVGSIDYSLGSIVLYLVFVPQGSD